MPTSINHAMHEYVPFEGRPNVLLGFHHGDAATQTKTYEIDYLLLATVRLMLKRAPKNTYIITGPSSANNEKASFTHCKVERDDEILGTLYCAYGRKGRSVAVDNERVKGERERGGPLVTSDAKRAATMALKKFIPQSSGEAMTKAYSAAHAALRTTMQSAASSKQRLLEEKVRNVQSYVEQNWDSKGKALLMDTGMQASDLEQLDHAIATHKQFNNLRASEKVGLTFVMQKGDVLYVSPCNLKTTTHDIHQRAFLIEDAPGELKGKMAMLKLVEGNAFIEDVGFKLEDAGYIIFYDLVANYG